MSDEIQVFLGEDDGFRSGDEASYSSVKIDLLKKNLAEFTANIGEILNDNDFSLPNASVDKLVFSVGVGAQGKVSLLGTGVSGSVNASIAIHVNLEKD